MLTKCAAFRHVFSVCVVCDQRGWGNPCPDCAVHRVQSSTLVARPLTAIGIYEGHLADAVRRLKYKEETRLARPLGYALAQTVLSNATLHSDRLDTRCATLVPVPLHPLRLAERGYNQAALLARATGRKLKRPVCTGLLHRYRHTQAQARLDARARHDNLDEAFVTTKRSRHMSIERILLVDDVVTTGSTTLECARSLTAAGFVVCGILAAAWAPPHA